MSEWFEAWFGEEYLELYPHRDEAEAREAVALLRRTLPWPDGLRVLDVGCGAGRHARAFAEAGARCVGVDLSMTLLRLARRTARVAVVRADMRRLPIRPRSMDLAVNLFTSFGYFADDAQHRHALCEMVATVRPGGWFAIDFLNAVTVRRTLVPQETATAGDRLVEIQRELSPDGRYVTKRMRLDDGREFLERVRLFGPDEIGAMLDAAGVRVEHRFGDYGGAPLVAGAPRTILLGRAA